MSIGASILNTELLRPHDRFMAQLRDAWKMIRGDLVETSEPNGGREESEAPAPAKNDLEQ